uniref:EGF-like domain-containing protein n=1 Tax=Monodelphis domestica TaxID=13616 RepID=A0A5F8H715_MONDO
MLIKYEIISILFFLKTFVTSGHTVCKRQKTIEWHIEPKSVTVNWSLKENICSDFYGECWANCSNTQSSSSLHQELNIPQICPLQLQYGDKLIISSELSSHFLGMNLMNVSKDTFINCLQNDSAQDELLFGCKLKGTHEVNPQWLSIGTHYLLTVVERSPFLCKLGLRLNVTVKQQFCQASQNAPFCSGHGRCLSEVWNKTYVCHCEPPYSGEFCQEVDECFQNPCHNNGICINKREGQNGNSYECIYLPQFIGKIFKCTTNVSQKKKQFSQRQCEFFGLCTWMFSGLGKKIIILLIQNIFIFPYVMGVQRCTRGVHEEYLLQECKTLKLSLKTKREIY